MFFPTVGLTISPQDSHMSIPLQLPTSANLPSNNSALVTLSQAGGDPVHNVHSLESVPNQTGVNPGQLQRPVRNPQSVLAVLGPQEAFQRVT